MLQEQAFQIAMTTHSVDRIFGDSVVVRPEQV